MIVIFSYYGKIVHSIPGIIVPLSILPKISKSPVKCILDNTGILIIFFLDLSIFGNLSNVLNNVAF